MTAMTYNPWQFFDSLGREVATPQRKAQKTNWAPAVDISELNDSYVIAMDVPGVDPSNIDVSAEKRVLKIEGSRLAAETQEGVEFVRKERVNGSFMRNFQLPENADLDAIDAKYSHGELFITIPKKEESSTVKIEVKH